MNLFFGLFGWRKATKCKRLIKRVQCRVKLLKNKRETIIRHLREDVVQLLKTGEDQRAFLRVDQLSKDQNIVAAYDLLDHFCEFILINLPYIRQHKDCPNDINEAASSLLYASARCGDLPELIELRKLFGRRYGKTFAMGAVELLPGNLVNRQVIEKLTVKSVSHEVKFRLMNQIAIDNGLELGPPEIDCKLELQQDKVYDLTLAIYDFDSDKKVTDVVESLSSNQINSAAKVEKPKELDHHLYEPEIILHRFSSQSYPRVSSSSRVSSASIQHKIETITEPASEHSFQLSERNIVYLDDVKEFKVQPRVQEDAKDKDQRLFMFKETFTSSQEDNRASLSDLNNDRDLYTDARTETCEKTDGKTGSRNTAKKRKSTRRRLKRRHNQIENQMSSCSTSTSCSIKDMESEMYYKDELNRRPHHRKKHQREMSNKQERQVSSKTSHRKKLTSTEQWYCDQPEVLYIETSLPRRSKCNFNCDVDDNCCLESPCYFITSEDRDDWDCPTPRSSVSQSHKPKMRRKVYTKKRRHEVESCASSSGSRSRKMNPVTRPPYLRTSMTMPPRERPKDIVPSDQLVKFASCEFPQKSTSHSNGSSLSSCRHIHPKLPDYDELTARFTALKEDYMRSSRSEFSHGSSRS